MNSKELFQKIKSSLTEALNKEDGIMLGGKKITFRKHDKPLNGKSANTNSGCVEVHVFFSEFSETMWYVNVYNVLYHMSAAIYVTEELKKTFGAEKPLISQNDKCCIENGFQIVITFAEGQIKDS